MWTSDHDVLRAKVGEGVGCLQFVEKAPAAVVGGVRAQATEAEEKLQILIKRAQQLEAMAAASANS